MEINPNKNMRDFCSLIKPKGDLKVGKTVRAKFSEGTLKPIEKIDLINFPLLPKDSARYFFFNKIHSYKIFFVSEF